MWYRKEDHVNPTLTVTITGDELALSFDHSEELNEAIRHAATDAGGRASFSAGSWHAPQGAWEAIKRTAVRLGFEIEVV